MGRSYSVPCFLISAGAKFTTILLMGKSNPEFFNAERTRSRLSFTAGPANPTSSKLGNPVLTSTSMSTQTALFPIIAALDTFITNRPP